jgi:hypothetical protein
MPENHTESSKMVKWTSWRRSQRLEQNNTDALEGSTTEGTGFGKTEN